MKRKYEIFVFHLIQVKNLTMEVKETFIKKKDDLNRKDKNYTMDNQL